MHNTALQYVLRVAPRAIDGLVIEFGSHNVNGSIRGCFPGTRYIGIDPWAGDGVDVVGRCQDYVPTEQADIVVTCEALEHDADASGHLDAAYRCLKPGGLLILTCAGPGRAEHGCNGGALPDTEHYGNIDPEWLWGYLTEHGWRNVSVEHNIGAGDTYAIARRP
jgi:SAM-dependent methyltransferase